MAGQGSCHVGAANRATGDWLLFTDADVLFRPDALAELAYAEAEPADHVVLFPRMIMHTLAKDDTAFFQMLFVSATVLKVADPKTKTTWGRRVHDPSPCTTPSELSGAAPKYWTT
jgi:hypothetical protein